MNKGTFAGLIGFMTLALLGIILVQKYWIDVNINNRERQFSLNVNLALTAVSEQIKDRELRDYLAAFLKKSESVGSPKISELTDVFQYVQRNSNTQQTTVYEQGIIKDDYGIFPSDFDSLAIDTLPIFDYRTVKTTTIINENFDNVVEGMTIAERYQQVERLSNMDQAIYESVFMDLASKKKISERVNNLEIELLLRQELLLRDIDPSFEFSVYEGNRKTDLSSVNYLSTLDKIQFKTPLFLDTDKKSRYELRISFPDKDVFITSSVWSSIVLSVLFTLIIIVVFASTLYQVIKQKKISEIKTDFINNMTHEFKTPIATINLALDAMSNVHVGPEKIKNYMNMIRQENKRMNTQVENVLQISQLDKKELDLHLEPYDPQQTLKNAIEHVRLMVNQRGGTLNATFSETYQTLQISKTHLTNVWVNLLENAIKYSTDLLDIKVQSKWTESTYEVIVSDKGIGMSSSVKKRIFDKFYREHTGNIHNVKGHGLGLAYVKRIVEIHNGTISVESQPKLGSTFTVSIPQNK